MDIKELEARFKEIDEHVEANRQVEVKLEGETESSGNLNISVERRVRPVGDNGESAFPSSGDESSVQTETVLDVNLAEVDVPEEYIYRKMEAVFSNEAPVGLLPGAVLRQSAATRDWELVEDYTYSASAYSITAVRGFIYDRASIPPLFWPLIDKDALSGVPPLFHDLLYRYGGVLPENQDPARDGKVAPYRTFQRKEADDLFFELMLQSGVKRWRAILAYQAVRKVARFAWQAKP